MRIAIGALLFEGNSFALGRVGIEAFQNNYLFRGSELIDRLRIGNVEMSGAISVLEKFGAEVIPLIATHGGCGGAVLRQTFEELLSEMLAPLNGPAPDGIYLALHGAMACDETEHPEVELLTKIRELVGDIPIVISLDLHANVTPELLKKCDAIVCYQQYPHDDTFETGIRGAGLLLKILTSGQRPKMEYRKLAMLISPTMGGTRLSPVMNNIYKECRALEAIPGVLSSSYFMLTPWLETPDGGSGFILVTEPSLDTSSVLESLCKRLWAHRHDLVPHLTPLAEAVKETVASLEMPVILSEMSDAVGAGAAGDSVYALRQYIELCLEQSLLAQVVDPSVVRLARLQPVGSDIAVELGNKVENRYGGPVHLHARIERFHDGKFTYSGGLMGGIEATVGDSVVLSVGQIKLLVTSHPAYEYADEQFRAAGLDVRHFKYVIVKNPMNYQQSFSWAPKLYALDTPGAACADLTRLEWNVAERPFFPLDDSDDPILREVESARSLLELDSR
ncbi:M81 family metallopeptidase [Brucella pseudogrignonensis]|uniref:M81 family metallopeptidase n=1 Tax=Brucella pseudogrignonensis TaxID=419475 RepID=UPI003D9662EC